MSKLVMEGLVEGTNHFNTCAQWLLAQDMEIGINGFDSLFSMHRSHGCNDHSLQAFLFEHLIIVLIQTNSKRFEVLLSPLNFFVVGCAGCYKLCPWSAVQEMSGMSFAHAAEACAGDSELLRGHFWGSDDRVRGEWSLRVGRKVLAKREEIGVVCERKHVG
jgi:hypothetical protein